jgi:hypothetical protein
VTGGAPDGDNYCGDVAKRTDSPFQTDAVVHVVYLLTRVLGAPRM